MEAAPAPTEPRKRTFRFKPVHDVALLRAVMRHRPWTAAHGETMSVWTSICAEFNAELLRRGGTAAIGAPIDPRAGQRRYKTLIDAHLSGDVASLRSSGLPEDVAQREQLIADVHRMAKGYRSDRNGRRHSKTLVVADEGDEQQEEEHEDELALALEQAHEQDHEEEHGSGHHRKRVREDSDPDQDQDAAFHEVAAKRVATGDLSASDDVVEALAMEAAAGGGNAMAWEFLRRHLESSAVRQEQELRLAEEKLELDKQRFELEKRERETFVEMMSTQLRLIQQLEAKLQEK